MSKQAANPYRSILRRRMPEPVLALLIFVMGVWLWDNHFTPKLGWEDEVGRMALRKTDRDLRLADGVGHYPAPLRDLLGIPDREEALRDGVASLTVLAVDRSLDEEGKFALSVLRGASGVDGVALPLPPDAQEVVRRVGAGDDSWWDREYLRRLGGLPEAAPLPGLIRTSDPRSRELAVRAVVARGAVWALVVAGLAFLPAVASGYGRALGGNPRGYVNRWPAGLGLGFFLLAYLASLGFAKALETGLRLASLGGGGTLAVPPVVFTLLDATSRLLPALLACAFLFRSARHAWDRLGIGAAPEWKLVLGSFSLLALVDQALRHLVGQGAAADPAGGLSEMEAGWHGLVFALASACIAAPVVEEILFRGVLFRSLANGIRVPAATLASAAVFAVAHFYDAYGLISVGLLGAACALCFAVSGRLATAIVLHALYNLAIKVPQWIVYHAPL